MSTEELRDFGNFLYHGYGSLDQEIASEVLQVLVQPKRTLLYSRTQNCAGIQENFPTGIRQRIQLPYDIVSALSKRNQVVGNGQDGTKERRVITSQNQIEVRQKGSDIDVTVLYIPFIDISERRKISFIAGGAL